ncbi:membrane fusion protein, multidrug efflux system [Tranquillimonas rosea]|uniref:Membrane fusion protein, multidrug efflux system n=1 Tax=Tranquillimonas rosea TaxID=641238 RepID=A0A1H9PYP6_9RHOB|nr:efflux RND transporter periplasmic adaptor subunit [Tranquillimonas rosea]SER52879.1 membrane fusion protein, multidrug efflux system [Tranquillimonas rosea]
MRPMSILIAALVAFSLYLLVLERPALLALAGVEPPAPGAATDVAPAASPNAVSVVAVTSQARPIDSAVLVRGQTEAARIVEVRAETAGKIDRPPLRKGADVSEGQVLCRLDPGTRENALAEAQARLLEARAATPAAEARLVEARAALEEAQVNDTAAQRLSQDGFASQTRVAATRAGVESARAAIQAATGGLETARAQIETAAAAVAAAETELSRLEIRAPFDGLLESDTAELGALMQTGGLCATVIQLDPIKLVGFLPETEVDLVSVGAGARARLASGRSVEGEVTFLSRSADPQTRTFRVEVEVANTDLSIRDGQTAEIVIEAEGREAHLLPQSALTLNDGGDLGLRTVASDGTAQFVGVQVMRDTPEGVYVTGLDETADVIVVGQEFVTDGVPVTPTYRDAGR